MTERVRKRTSKWDLTEDPPKFPIMNRQDMSFGRGNESNHDSRLKHERNSSKNTGNRYPKGPDTNPNSGLKSEGNSRWPSWEPPSGYCADLKDDYDNRGFNEVSQTMKTWDRNRGYSTSMSPGLDGWRHQSRSRSPRSIWSKSHRSRSRSPPRRLRSRSRSPPRRLRSRSRSPPRGRRSRSRSPPRGLRSRSRSPPHGLERDSEGWNDRTRGRSGVSPSLCSDFVRGRCRRASQCRFLHQENNGYEDRRHSVSIPEDNWGSRPERVGSYVHPNNLERDYSRDELSHGYESQRSKRSSEVCINFIRGKCARGSSCRFIHETSIADGRGTSERAHERDLKSYSGHDHRREPHRNNGALCKFFAAGNCLKGINCKFSHESAAHDRSEGRSVDDRRGRNLGDENRSWGGSKRSDEAAVSAHGSAQRCNDKTWEGSKWNDEATDSTHVSGQGWSPTDGSGRTGNSGLNDRRWDKQSVGLTWNDDKPLGNRPEGRSASATRSDENKSRGGTKWSDEAGDLVHDTVEEQSVNNGRIQSGWDDSRWNKKPILLIREGEGADPEVQRFPKGEKDDNGGQFGNEDEKKSLGGPKWSDNAIGSEATKIPDWRNDNDVQNSIPVTWPTQRSLDDRRDYIMDDSNRTLGCLTRSDIPSDQDVHKSPPWISDNKSARMGVQLPRGRDETLNFMSVSSDGAEKHQYPHFIDNERSAFGIQDIQSCSRDITMLSHEENSVLNVSGQHHPASAMHPEGVTNPASTVMIYPAVSAINAQSQHIFSSPSPRLQSFDLNGPVEDFASPNHQTLLHTRKTINEAGENDPKKSPITQNITTEQVAKISHLSASLAQIFGNKQQLPQLYASLNSTNPYPNSTGPGASVGGSYHQSNQNAWCQKPYDPFSSSMESSQVSVPLPGILEMPVKPNSTADHESQTPVQSSVLSSVAGGANGIDPSENDNKEKMGDHQSNELNQSETDKNDKAIDCIVKEQETAPSGEANGDGGIDEDAKKSKDTKGMRMFKFALVEFVKEILKPTWKEGQLSKDAHKAVVKKVIDKVTGSVQEDHIPQTQEKIDQYLAYSKTKLTKLVEAYVERYLKT
ncbi:Zinc finger ccch domain-containing protein [Thalictrum thalictroides]|uniref:Zinc finger ccch domain-containing protein n=1 Tax=Thalictrum thalictroides TaxID=46969 RepID=A0A7J6WD42_THATH|nr:Zinc finger ccch domain-containing protein [Thalictrum thalictroides]